MKPVVKSDVHAPLTYSGLLKQCRSSTNVFGISWTTALMPGVKWCACSRQWS